MLTKTYVVLFFAVLQLMSAQSYILSGSVVDSTTNTVLENATVHIVDLNKGVSTNSRGGFSMELPSGVHTMIVRLLGYTDRMLTVTVSKDLHRVIRLVPSEIELSEVRITGESDRSGLTASSQSVIVMTPQDVDRHRGQTLGKALESINGITVLSTGPSISKPVIRGLHSQRVRVLNAGVPQEGQQWGGEHAPEIDPFAASRIEVLKGVSGVEFGAGAIGGVIKLQPRELRTVPGIGGELTLNGFSNNRQASGSLLIEGGPDLVPELSWRVQGSARQAGNSSAPDYVIGNSGFNEFDASAAFGYRLSDLSISGYYSHFGTELGIYKGSHLGNLDDLYRALTAGKPLQEYTFTYDIVPPKQEITHDLWSINVQYPVHSVGMIEAQYGWQSNARKEYDGHLRSRGLPNFDLTLTTYSGDLKLKHDPIGKVFGTLGVSGMRQGNVGQGLSFLIPNFRSYSGGVYLLETYSQDPLTVSFGGRIDLQSLEVFPYAPRNIVQRTHEYTNATAAAGIIYQLNEVWSANFNIGSGWRPPSVNELYSYGVHHGTAQFEIGNRDLTPERSYGIDVTLKNRSDVSNAEIGLYVNSMKGFIFAFPSLQPTLTLRGIFPTMIYQQSDVLIRGIDASYDHVILDDVRLGTSVSIVIGDDVRSNQPLFQMPADRGRAWIHYHLPLHLGLQEAYLELTGTGVTKQSRIPVNADYAPAPSGYFLTDLDYGGEFIMGPHLVRFSVSIQNIFNHSYRDYLSRFRYFIDNPGRDVVVRVNIPFGKSFVSN